MVTAVVEGLGSIGYFTATQEGSQSPDKPPTGPGSPAVRTADSTPEKGAAPDTIRLVSDHSKRLAARGSNGRVRTPPKPANLEAAAREAYANGATSVEKMQKALWCSRSAASAWVRTLRESDAVRAQQTAQ